jgi:hypothetical protein
MMFAPRRKHTYGFLRPLMGIALPTFIVPDLHIYIYILCSYELGPTVYGFPCGGAGWGVGVGLDGVKVQGEFSSRNVLNKARTIWNAENFTNFIPQ